MIERTGTATAILLAGAMLFSCNRDEVIENDNAAKPQIILDSESGSYTVNEGYELTIAPAYRNAEGAS
ncbi:MAG: PKD domain containing protein, partial [Duncaniella sp.]|nr:PKD domain containing protein [Duncaniella sp.]